MLLLLFRLVLLSNFLTKYILMFRRYFQIKIPINPKGNATAKASTAFILNTIALIAAIIPVKQGSPFKLPPVETKSR